MVYFGFVGVKILMFWMCWCEAFDGELFEFVPFHIRDKEAKVVSLVGRW
jgi:hypothetical protein